MDLLLYLLGGCIAGFLAGVLGIGGGLVIVPFLSIALPLSGIAPELTMHMAIGTAAAVIICTASLSAYSHYRHQGLEWPMLYDLLPGLLLGALIGGLIGNFLSGILLKIIFAFFVIFMALKMGFNLSLHDRSTLPSKKITFLICSIMGSLCAMLGMGGGVFIIPFLRSCQLKMLKAVGIAAACAVPVSIISTLSYIVGGFNNAHLPAWSLGYVYLPALLGCALASMCMVPLGAKLAHRLPAALLQKVFAIFLFVVAVNMLFF